MKLVKLKLKEKFIKFKRNEHFKYKNFILKFLDEKQ